MPEVMRNYISSVNRPGNSWVEQDYDFPERPTSAASSAMPPCKIIRLPAVSEAKPERTIVDDFVPSVTAHELTEALGSDLVQGMQGLDAPSTVYVILDAECEEVIDVEGHGGDATLLEYVSGKELDQIREWGIQDQVNKALGVIPNTYRTLRETVLNISEDPEIPDRKRLRVTLSVSGTPEEVFQDELNFKDWMYSELDAKAGELITITYEWE